MVTLGYLTLPASINRTLLPCMEHCLPRFRRVVRENIAELKTILRWNAEDGVGLFWIRQNLIPSHAAFPYDWETEHGDELREARLSMHPGHYVQLESMRPEVTQKSLAELRYVTFVLELLGAMDGVIVLHMGGAYADKRATAARFIEAVHPETGTLRYLALENDEWVWAATDITATAEVLGIPAITDAFHHDLNLGGLSLTEALDLSLSTWARRGARPKLHLSIQAPRKQPGAHAFSADLAGWRALLEALDGREARVMVEAKGKEQVVVPLSERL